nr:HAD-IIA family hydrolase [Acuticoccus mangrovi]
MPPIEAIIADLDGVVFRGAAPIASAVDAFAAWRAAGIPYAFVSNNSTKSPAEMAAKLTAMGVPATEEQVVTSSTGTMRALREGWPRGGKAVVLGAPSLEQAVEAAGFVLTEDADADCVVVGLDRDLTYRRLDRAVAAVLAGAAFIGTNADRLIPESGHFAPGAGAMIAAVAAATGVTPRIIGKPGPDLIEEAIVRLGVARDRVIMIGDQVATDIAAARAAGVFAVLVETGVANPLPHVPEPDLTLADLTSLRPPLAA